MQRDLNVSLSECKCKPTPYRMMKTAEEMISDTTGLSSSPPPPPSYFCRQKQDNELKTTAA